MQKLEHVDLVRGAVRMADNQDPAGGQGSLEKGGEGSGDRGRTIQDDELPHQGSDRHRDEARSERSAQGRVDLYTPWAISDISSRHSPWRTPYYVVDSTGYVIGIFEDEKIAARVVELINASRKPQDSPGSAD